MIEPRCVAYKTPATYPGTESNRDPGVSTIQAAMIELIILSITQGIAEFLPISSSGHLSVLQYLFEIQDSQALDIFLHLATFFAILVYFRRPILDALALHDRGNQLLWLNVLMATCVTGLFYFVFQLTIDASFDNMLSVGIGFLATTVILGATRFSAPREDVLRIPPLYALVVGLAQGIAVFPGVSRSGTTIACLLLLGIAPAHAGFFSMLLFLPAILGAIVIKADVVRAIPYSSLELGLAFALTFAVSYVSLAFLMRFLGRRKLHHFGFWTFLMFVFSVGLAWSAPEDGLAFAKSRISDATFEAGSIFDVDRDGHPDLVSGAFWYPGPEFAEAHKICDVAAVDDYFDDFADYPMDVNGDGYLDIVTGAWWGQTLRWRENPKGETVEWVVHDIAMVGAIERPCFWDIDRDGVVEVVPNTPGSPQRIFRLTGNRLETRLLSERATQHGLGFGDIDGDGRGDLVYRDGWFKAPEDPWAGDWTWQDGPTLFASASVPILVHDVNADGLADLIAGAGHDYGLAWWAQHRDASGGVAWTRHDIETDRSQFHEMALADLDNDGEPELVTGKRWRAHSGRDPGANDPVGLYFYEMNHGEFVRHTIDYGPAGEAGGTGIYLWIEDIDGDGWKDILAPGKTGLRLYRNEGPR